MEWIDTLMLEPKRENTNDANARPGGDSAIDSIKAVSARVLAVQGVSLLHAFGRNSEELTAALEILRAFRATGRRVVLCDTTNLAPGRQVGRLMVENSGVEAVVSCGAHGRELAIGARDAGLDLASVIVCPGVKAACESLVRRLCPGDTVLLWGVDQQTCNRIVMWLEKHFVESCHVAA